MRSSRAAPPSSRSLRPEPPMSSRPTPNSTTGRHEPEYFGQHGSRLLIAVMWPVRRADHQGWACGRRSPRPSWWRRGTGGRWPRPCGRTSRPAPIALGGPSAGLRAGRAEGPYRGARRHLLPAQPGGRRYGGVLLASGFGRPRQPGCGPWRLADAPAQLRTSSGRHPLCSVSSGLCPRDRFLGTDPGSGCTGTGAGGRPCRAVHTGPPGHTGRCECANSYRAGVQ
jgi:hypothetical protein